MFKTTLQQQSRARRASEELSGQAELMKEMIGKFNLRQQAKSLPTREVRLLGEDSCQGSKPRLKASSGPKILLANDEYDKY